MTVNVVTVTVQADASPVDPVAAEGNIVAVPSGVAWPDGSNNPIVPMVVHAYLGDNSITPPVPGKCQVQLVASDNFAAGVLGWDFIINIRGLPTVNVHGVQVNFSSGATQSVWSILGAAGWTPLASP